MLAVVLASILAEPALQDPGSALLEPVEIRALVVRHSDLDVLGTPAALGEALQRLSEMGFNAVVPMAWERGRTLRPSSALAAAGVAESLAFPGRDVLQEIVFEAHRAGLEVLVGIDGAWTLDPATPPPKLELAAGSKDRLDPRDAAVRALARGFALDLARAAEIDGFVLWNGLTAFTLEEARDPAAAKAREDSTKEFAAWREELRAFDKSLVIGSGLVDPRFAPPFDARSLDFVVHTHEFEEASTGLAAWVAEKPGRAAALWSALDETTTPETFSARLVAARAKPFQGELLESFAALHARDNVLSDVLDQGIEAPYYARATLPWRGGTVWRPVAEFVELSNDSGSFEDVDSDIPYSTLAAGLRGSASWALKPSEKGAHELWVWLQPGDHELPSLQFTIPTDPRRVQRVVVPAHVPRGWTRVARTVFSSNRKEDVLRLEVPEGGAQPIAIGPLVALPSRRLENR